MGGPFREHAVVEQAGDLVIRAARAEHLPCIPLRRREQAVAKLPVGGEPQPVAAFAEGMRYGVDKPDDRGLPRGARPLLHAVADVSIVDRRLAFVGADRGHERPQVPREDVANLAA